MKNIKNKEIWFITGSQDLYGQETLNQVDRNTAVIVDGLNRDANLIIPIVKKEIVTTPDEIFKVCLAANSNEDCIGVIHNSMQKYLGKRSIWIL